MAGLSVDIIDSILAKWSRDGSVVSKPSPHQPRMVNCRGIRHIVKAVKHNRRSTALKITNIVNEVLSKPIGDLHQTGFFKISRFPASCIQKSMYFSKNAQRRPYFSRYILGLAGDCSNIIFQASPISVLFDMRRSSRV